MFSKFEHLSKIKHFKQKVKGCSKEEIKKYLKFIKYRILK